MMIELSTTMIKILIFRNYRIYLAILKPSDFYLQPRVFDKNITFFQYSETLLNGDVFTYKPRIRYSMSHIFLRNSEETFEFSF